MKYFFILFLWIPFIGFNQNQYLLFFKDKNIENVDYGFLSGRSINKREKRKIPFDYKDYPVNETYIQKLKSVGKVTGVSRWLNAVAIISDKEEDEILKQFAFVKEIRSVRKENSTTIKKMEEGNNGEKSINYGLAYQQQEMMNLRCLYNKGYTGSGVFLAVIDAGFTGMDTLPVYFDSVYQQGRIVDIYDFVDGDSSVYHSSTHGTLVSSCIFANFQQSTIGQDYVGTGKDVTIALYRTEDVSSETLMEEFYLVQALERCDEKGVDLVNISLGYLNFDDSTENHSYLDRDGNTTIAAIGVNTAVSKGIAVVVAAGNSAPEYISTPCDADSALCVGALDLLGNYAPFSSVGPNSDGQVKPDVAVPGQDVYVVLEDGTISQGSGTSFASPILCGGVACLIEANPNKSVIEIYDAIRQSASQYSSPDSLKGYGIPDFCLANEILNPTTGLNNDESNQNNFIFPNPTSGEFKILNSFVEEVEIVNVYGQKIDFKKQIKGSVIEIDISNSPNGTYFCRTNVGVYKIVKR